jgi:hypothetical protein
LTNGQGIGQRRAKELDEIGFQPMEVNFDLDT